MMDLDEIFQEVFVSIDHMCELPHCASTVGVLVLLGVLVVVSLTKCV